MSYGKKFYVKLKTIEMSVFLQKYITVALSFLFAVNLVKAQKPIQVMMPAGKFDDSLASKMLNGGTAIVKGIVYYEGRTLIGIKSEATVYAPVGSVVALYPLTPYIDEYLKLKSKNKEGKRMAAISRQAASYRIESKVFSDKGEFAIQGLRPGKYYIESLVNFPSGIGGKEVSAVVEIKSEGETIQCKLNHIYRGFIY
jgi:UDP-N-acetylmuramyl pentapeptide phosphotransferase/UDP-N-acetylglucosamine-1-phosphate transferase